MLKLELTNTSDSRVRLALDNAKPTGNDKVTMTPAAGSKLPVTFDTGPSDLCIRGPFHHVQEYRFPLPQGSQSRQFREARKSTIHAQEGYMRILTGCRYFVWGTYLSRSESWCGVTRSKKNSYKRKPLGCSSDSRFCTKYVRE